MTATLPEAIDAFAVLVGRPFGWDTPTGALNNCGDASLAFERFCAECSLPAQKVAMTGLPDYVRELWEADCGLCLSEGGREDGAQDCHVVVRVGDLFVDWTRRQYQPDADFPHVSTRADLEAEGWHIATQKAGAGS